MRPSMGDFRMSEVPITEVVSYLATIALIGAGVLLMLRKVGSGAKVIVVVIVLFALGTSLDSHTLLSVLTITEQYLPKWLIIFLAALVFLGLLRLILTPFLSKEAASRVVGTLMTDILKYIFNVALLPLRLLRRFMD